MPQRKLFDQKTLNSLKKYPLYSQDGKGKDAIVSARIFNPYGRGAWYITEYDGKDTMYGFYKNARVNVMGYKLPLERDAYFKPTTAGKASPQSMLGGGGFDSQTNGGSNGMGNSNG